MRRRVDVLGLVLDGLAIYRLTRLATADTITRPARARLIRKAYELRDGTTTTSSDVSDYEWDRLPEDDDDAPALAEFVKCRWCMGLWISGFVIVARRYAPRVWDPLARVLAGGAAAALVAGVEK